MKAKEKASSGQYVQKLTAFCTCENVLVMFGQHFEVEV